MTKKILVADNSITIQKIVAMAFENEDAIVEGVSNGKDALDRMETFKPDIVLADVDMQDLTGFNLSKKIKNDPKFDATKILLLASDFEDFNTNLFNNSGADDHISKPFKSEDIIKKVFDLLSRKPSNSASEIIDLSTMELDEPVEPSETTIELSAERLVKEDGSTINLTSLDLEESTDHTRKEVAGLETEIMNKSEEDLLDVMIEDVENLKKAVVPSDSDYDELSDEVAPTEEDMVGDELDLAFREIANAGSKKEPRNITSIQLEPLNRPPAVDGIIAEPEDLLSEIASSMAEEKKRLATSSFLEQNPSRTSKGFNEIKGQETTAAKGNQMVAEQVKHTLEDMIHTCIEKELADISNSVTQSVREIIKEITPKIVREIVKEEIDKIKNS